MNISLSEIEKIGIFREEALGRVYEGNIRGTRRRVIVKELLTPPSLDKAGQVKLRLRFLEESQIMKNVLTPSLAIPLTVSEEDHRCFVVYPLPPGIPLNSFLLSRGALPPVDALVLLKRLILCYQVLKSNNIHRANVIPGDMFVTENLVVKMVDTTLGVYDTASGLANTGFLTGDKAFYSPEQIKKGKASEQSLVFSLGLILYWMLAGRPLYQGNSPFETLSGILGKPYTSLPGEVGASLELYDFARQMLHADESKRFPSLEALSDSLTRVLDKERVEKELGEQEEKLRTEELTVIPDSSYHPLRTAFTWALFLFVLVLGGVKIKEWFFTGYAQPPVVKSASLAIIRRAQEEVDRQNWEAARTLAMNVLSREGDNPGASFILGESYFGAGQYKQAITYLEQSRRSLDEAVQCSACCFLVQSLIHLDQLKKADYSFREVIPPRGLSPNEMVNLEKRWHNVINLCFTRGREMVKTRSADQDSLAERLHILARIVEKIDDDCMEKDYLKGMEAYYKQEYESAFEHLNRYCLEAPDDLVASAVLRKVTQTQNLNTIQ